MRTAWGKSLFFAIAMSTLVVSAWVGRAWAEPTFSSPIALTRNDRFVWVVNPDNDSVSVLEVGGNVNSKAAEIAVGNEPRGVCLTPNDDTAYVTNMVSGTVSVLDTRAREVIKTIRVGAEPFGCAVTPDGDKVYVANFSSDTVSVISTRRNRHERTIPVGPKPRGVAITDDGTVYVTHFLALLRENGRRVEENEGRDDGKEGRVTVISSRREKVVATVVLNPLADVGFRSRGSTLDRTVFDPVANAPLVAIGAFPNLLQSIVIRGNRAYLPNTSSSPNGPFRFNVNVQSFLSVFDTGANQDSGQTINMNRGVQFEAPGRRLFITNPIALAFEHSGNEGWVVSAATNRIVRVVLDTAGAPTINAPTAMDGVGTAVNDPAGIVRIEVGKNPQGIVINSTDTRAYVMNFISRTVSVINLAANPPAKLTDITSASLPAPDSSEATVHRGHELFNTSIGPAGTQENALPPAGRMSDFGWGSCYGCHPDGLTDGVTWMFPDGPRQTISMESTFAHPQPPDALVNGNDAPLLPSSHQRVLNWSAVRDEVQDFELNIRGVSGGQGLIRKADGSLDPCVFNLRFNVAPNPACPPEREAEAATTTGRDPDQDAIAAYIAFGIRAPLSPLRGKFKKGRRAFEEANCQSCHGGVNWTTSQVDFTPPPTAADITGGQLVRFLAGVSTFDANAFNEKKAGGGAGQLNTDGANGMLGINVPSLLSVFAGAPYFHSGACQTLECVLDNVAHRSAGTGGTDTLSNPAKRRRLIKFLRSIDADTRVFP